MRDDELDRVLSAETGIVPSSGFTASVMDAVRREAAIPPPIPFPWKRALPGLAACIAVLVVAVFASHSPSVPEIASSSYWERLLSGVSAASSIAVRLGAGWVALSLLLSLASVALSMRLTRWHS